MRILLFHSNLFFCLLAALYAFFAHGEGLVLNEEALARRLQAYQTITDHKVRFEQTKHLTEMNLNLVSSGQMTLFKKGEVVWEIEKPSHLKVVLDAKEVRIERPSGTERFQINEMSKDTAAKGVGMIQPWLTMNAKLLSQHYVVHQTSDNDFDFEPRDVSPFKHIRVHLAKAGHVQNLRMEEASGDWLTIEFGAPVTVRSSGP